MPAAAKAPVSSVLLEANRRLYELRAAVQGQEQAARGRWPIVGSEPGHSLAGRGCGQAEGDSLENDHQDPTSPPAANNPGGKKRNDTIKLHPSIATGMLAKKQTAAGRIWLLLRYMDRLGRGWLPLDVVRRELSGKETELHICGRRQLRNLLRQGRGVFWQQDDSQGRLWLKSAGKVAAALGVPRLTGRPVELKLAVLLDGIGALRAHFYASFHSGRRSEMPISRATLETVTHVPPRTQRVYERTAGVTSQKNIAIGGPAAAETIQERAWRHGRASFIFTDKRGRQGQAGGRYVAWRLPNSYQGPHKPSPRGRQKKINRQIDLVTIGAQGNGLGLRADDRLFHANGHEAGKLFNRNGKQDVYWPANGRKRRSSSPPVSKVWQVLPSIKGW